MARRLAQSPARRVLGDWGTTRLRLLLVDDREILEQRDGPGIGALTHSPADALLESLGDWRDGGLSHVVLAGMAGSRNGLLEVPYLQAPAGRFAWSRAARSIVVHDLSVTVAAGLRCDREDAADVMRGEENQIYGAIEMNPALSSGVHLFVLPGTHSKWVAIEDGAIVRFHTALTGELYALLRDHSILLRTGAVVEHSQPEFHDGFSAGIERANASGIGLVNTAFEARTSQLLSGRSHSWASGLLSGLVIGEEIRGLSSRYSTERGATLIGEPQLTALYASAFGQRGIRTDILDGAACALRGLRFHDTSNEGHTP
jgi:2-dehydro-3-deoxygalactonokinase